MSQNLHVHSLGNGRPIEIQGCHFERPVHQQSYKEQYNHSRLQQDGSQRKHSNGCHHWTRPRTKPPRFQTSPAASRAPVGNMNTPLSPMASEKTRIPMSSSAVNHQPLSPTVNNDFSSSINQQPPSPTMNNPHSPTLPHPPGLSQPLMKPQTYLHVCELPNLQTDQRRQPSCNSVPAASPPQFSPSRTDQQPASANPASTYEEFLQQQSPQMADHAVRHQRPPGEECGSPMSQKFPMQHNKPAQVETNLEPWQSVSTAMHSHSPNPLQLSPGPPHCVAQQMGAQPASLYDGISLMNCHPFAGQGGYAPPPWCMHPAMGGLEHGHMGQCPQPGMLSTAIDAVMPINYQHPSGNQMHDDHIHTHQQSPMRPLPLQMSPLNYFTFSPTHNPTAPGYPPYEQRCPPPPPPRPLPPPYPPLHFPSPPRPFFPSPFRPPFLASSPLVMPYGYVPVSQLLKESEQIKNCRQQNTNQCNGPVSTQEQSGAIREQRQQQQQQIQQQTQSAGVTSEEQSALSENASVDVASEHVQDESGEMCLSGQSCPLDDSRKDTSVTLSPDVQPLDDEVKEDLSSLWELAKCSGMNMSCSAYFYQMLSQLNEFKVCINDESNPGPVTLLQKSCQASVPQALDMDLDQKFFLPSELLALM